MTKPLFAIGDTFYLAKSQGKSFSSGYYRIVRVGVSAFADKKLYANDLRMWSYNLIKIRKNGEMVHKHSWKTVGWNLQSFEGLVSSGLLTKVDGIPETSPKPKKEPNLSAQGTKNSDLRDISDKKISVGQRVATTMTGENSLTIMKVLRLTDKMVVLSEDGKKTTVRFPHQCSIIS